MASVFAHLFDTLPFAAALADIKRNHGYGLEQTRPSLLRQYIRYLGKADVVEQGMPGLKGYPPDQRGADDDPNLPPRPYWDAWVWTWHSEGTKVTNIDCRARGNRSCRQRVLETLELGRHEAGREIKPEVRVETGQGDTLILPLDAKHLHSKWKVVKGDMTAGSHWLWPLPANLDSAVVAAYAYDLVGHGFVPYQPPADDVAERALATYGSASAPSWTKDALGGGFMQAPPAGGSHAADVNGDVAVFGIGPPRILVVVSFAVFKERADVEPGGLLGMTKIHPHIMVRSSVALTSVEAGMRGRRPERTMVLDGGDDTRDGSCCHSKDGTIHALFVNDNNLVDTDAKYNYPRLTFWSTVFSYIEVDPDKRLDGQMLKMVRRNMREKRTFPNAGKRIVPNLPAPGHHVDTVCEKLPRQGEFDNIHMAPRLSLEHAQAVVWFEDWSYTPSKPYPLTPANRASFHLDEIAMAPVCEHDCFHFHWRWLKGSTQPWTKGWGVSGPHSEPGATMVPLNQDVEVAIDGPHGFIYRATATAHDVARVVRGRRIIEPFDWQVFMHHGCAYAQDFGNPVTPSQVAASTAMLGRVFFLDRNGNRIDGQKNPAVLYWNYRYYLEIVDGTPTVKERLDVPQDMLDYLRRY